MNGPTYDQFLLPNAHHPHESTNLALIQQFFTVGLKSEKKMMLSRTIKVKGQRSRNWDELMGLIFSTLIGLFEKLLSLNSIMIVMTLGEPKMGPSHPFHRSP